MMRVAAVLVVSVAMLGCPRTRAATPAADPVPLAPSIVSLTPDSASIMGGAVVEVLVKGKGFAPGANPGRNTVEFGHVILANIAANDAGTELRFVVPRTYRLDGGAPPQRITPGEYSVVVRTQVGASNALTLRVR